MAKKSNFDNKSKFVELRAQGITYSEISRQLDVSKPTLIEWAKQCEIEIGNLKAIYLDEIYSKYCIAKMMRIELFGKTLESIQNELSKRDLADVSTEKLLEMLLKFSSRLRDEEVALSFKGDVFDKGLSEMNVGSWEA